MANNAIPKEIRILKDSVYMDSDGFPIAIYRHEPHPLCDMHCHEFCEIAIVTGGSGFHFIRDEQYPISIGDVFVVTSNCLHQYRNMDNLNLLNILYKPEKLKMSEWDIRNLPGYYALFTLEPTYRKQHNFQSRLHLNTPDQITAKQLFAQLEEELTNKEDGFRLMATGVFMELITFLSRCYSRSQADPSRALLRIAEAITFIEEHYTETVTLEQLADIAHMSGRHFQRIFKDTMNLSPIDYLLKIRIKHAADILTQSDCTITQCAFNTGFTDSNYFSRQFKKIMGVSPRDYRNGRSEL